MRVGNIIRNAGGVAVSGGSTTTLFPGGIIDVVNLGGGSWRVSAAAGFTEVSADSKYQPIGSYLSGGTVLFSEGSANAKYQPIGSYLSGSTVIFTEASADSKYQPIGAYITETSANAAYLSAGAVLQPSFTSLSATFYNFNYAGWADLEGQYRFETTGVNLVNAPFTPNAAAVYTILAEVHNCPVTNTHFVRVNLASFGDWGNNNRMFVRMGPDFASSQSLGWRQYLNDQGIIGKGAVQTRVSANRVVVSAATGFTETSADSKYQSKNTVQSISTLTSVSGGNRNTIYLMNTGAEIVLLNDNWVAGDRIEIIAAVSGVSVSAGAGITLNAATSAAGVTFDTPFAGATIVFTTATEAYAIGRLA